MKTNWGIGGIAPPIKLGNMAIWVLLSMLRIFWIYTSSSSLMQTSDSLMSAVTNLSYLRTQRPEWNNYNTSISTAGVNVKFVPVQIENVKLH